MSIETKYSIQTDQNHPYPYASISLNKVHTIKVHLLNEDFSLQTHDEDTFYVSGPSLSDKDYQLYVKDQTLLIERNDQHTITKTPYGDGQPLELYIPKQAFYREIQLTNKSGEGNINNLDADRIQITTMTGELKLDQIESTHFTLETISGDIKLRNLHASNANITSTNADIDLRHIKIKNALSIKTIEGDIDLEEGYSQELFFDTESGDLDCEEFYPNAIHFNSVEGDLDIKNKKTEHDIIIKSKQSIEGELSIK